MHGWVWESEGVGEVPDVLWVPVQQVSAPSRPHLIYGHLSYFSVPERNYSIVPFRSRPSHRSAGSEMRSRSNVSYWAGVCMYEVGTLLSSVNLPTLGERQWETMWIKSSRYHYRFSSDNSSKIFNLKLWWNPRFEFIYRLYTLERLNLDPEESKFGKTPL